MYAKGRQAKFNRKGQDNGCMKLDAPKVKEIRLQRLAGVPHKELSAIYGVTMSTIQRANNGRTWGHIK